MDKVSIIIPVYNVEKYLPECLESVLSQTYKQWEAILVDDGSKDSSGHICDRYAQLDARFRVIHQNNSGAASAKNTGLDNVNGDYIAFIDSDDFVEPHWLERLLTVAQKENADIVEYEFDKKYKTHTEKVNHGSKAIDRFTAHSYLEQYLNIWSNSLFCNKLLRKEVVGEIRFRRERRCIDDEFFTYKVLSQAKKIVRIPDVLYHYRQRASSAVYSERNQKQIADDALEVLVERYRWIGKFFPDLKKIFLWHDIQMMFFFADYWHTRESAKKFQRIRKFQLLQALKYPFDVAMLWTAIRLQFLPKKKLLEQKTAQQAQPGINDCFE